MPRAKNAMNKEFGLMIKWWQRTGCAGDNAVGQKHATFSGPIKIWFIKRRRQQLTYAAKIGRNALIVLIDRRAVSVENEPRRVCRSVRPMGLGNCLRSINYSLENKITWHVCRFSVGAPASRSKHKRTWIYVPAQTVGNNVRQILNVAMTMWTKRPPHKPSAAASKEAS